MICFCACRTLKTKQCILQIYADQSLEQELALVGDKYLVTDGKGKDVSYSFENAPVFLEKIHAGNACDMVITSSESLMQQLEEEDFISPDKTLCLFDTPMALFFAGTDQSLTYALEDFFYQEDNSDEDNYVDEVPEGYQRYIDVLWESVAEEDWQYDWEDRYSNLWIKEQIPSIGVLTEEQKEGQCAKEILNQYGDAFDLLDQIGLIRFFDSETDLTQAIREGEVQTGLCSISASLGTSDLQIARVFNQATDPTITYYVCLMDGSKNRKEAIELMTFLQSDYARRFFEDFGFNMR